MRETFIFIGDSITDSGRLDESSAPLGDGYVRLVAEALGEPVIVLNRGISGNRVRDLRARWKRDCLDLEPRLVSIAVGVNDTWRRYDSGDATSAEAFEDDYRALLAPLSAAAVELVLVEPFLLPLSDEQRTWREDLDEKIDIVRRLADAFDARLVRADEQLNERARDFGASAIVSDGVHLTLKGHALLAREWLRAARAVALKEGVPNG